MLVVWDAFQSRNQLLVAAHVCPTLLNISERVAGDYKQAACVSPFYSSLDMIKTMTNILLSSCFLIHSFIHRWRYFVLLFFSKGVHLYNLVWRNNISTKTVLSFGAQVDQPPLLTRQICRTESLTKSSC